MVAEGASAPELSERVAYVPEARETAGPWTPFCAGAGDGAGGRAYSDMPGQLLQDTTQLSPESRPCGAKTGGSLTHTLSKGQEPCHTDVNAPVLLGAED